MQFTMELAATESGNMPKCYSLDMSKDFIPMSVFSELSQGKLSVEGKILNKFDIKPHNENLENYGKLCHERTKKYMKNRKIQVIENDNGDDNGTHMRPMPGMIGFVAPGPSQFLKDILKELCVYNKKGANQGTYELKPEYRKSVEEPTPE